MINIKTEKEIEIMKEGGKILAEILKKLSEAVKPGITTNDLEKLARELVLSYDVESSFLSFDGYPNMLCTSINDEIVHGLPSGRVLREEDLLKIDMGVLHKGFHTDSATTVLVGNKGDAVKRSLIQVTKESLEIGISKAKVGNTLGDIGSAIQKHIEDRGFNVVRDLVGHGIGRELHEPPQVLNYGKAGTGEKLVSGMVIAIEPMVVTGKWTIKNGRDGYVFVTKDGGLAAHFEHTVAITERGPETLTK
jgi:methionyl aminopeptidase